jgi:putative ABC transport system permease protein
VLLRTDLINSWRQSTPPDAPNRFVLNLQPDQVEPFRAQLKDAAVGKYDLFPMIRGRLIAINGAETSPDKFTDERAKRLVDREFNLSHAADLPDHNKIVGGAWTREEAGGISVEKGIADTLGLKLGDTMKFDVGGMPVEAKISSLREVDWASMRANFFVMFPVSVLKEVPATYMSALKAPASNDAKFDNALSQNFPNVTVVDMSQTIGQVQRVLDQVIRAIEFLFGFTLLAGLIVLWATVSATREERAKEYAVLRAIGARSSLLRAVQRAELLGVGFLAGVLAGVVAMGMGWALAKLAFEFNWTVSLWTPLATGVAGAVLAWAAGYFGLRGVLNRPVMMSLREAV